MHKGEPKKLIEQAIITFLSPVDFNVEDDSLNHKGHAGAPEGAESHFNVSIKSYKFEGKTRIARQKMVLKLLADEFNSGLHALSMQLDVPE